MRKEVDVCKNKQFDDAEAKNTVPCPQNEDVGNSSWRVPVSFLTSPEQGGVGKSDTITIMHLRKASDWELCLKIAISS